MPREHAEHCEGGDCVGCASPYAWEPCPDCGGSRKRWEPSERGEGDVLRVCKTCKGSGRRVKK